MWHKARLYARTAPHLKPWQVAGRVAARLKKKTGLSRVHLPPSDLEGSLQAQVSFPQHDPWNTRAHVIEGRFCFLNRSEALGRPVDWRAVHTPLLWQFNLHYFHYLHLLEPREQEALCREWVRANPIGSGVGWHPYTTSLRTVNWCKADVKAFDLQQSLYRQAAHLYRNLETYVYGNHLLENARALVYAGSFFARQGEAPQWLEKGLELYRQETHEQILPDGGHYERSPMYHALMLEGYLDVLNLLPHDHPHREGLLRTVQQMCDVMASIIHPDGSPALFNDATQEIALAPHVLLDYARNLTGYTEQPKNVLPNTGYFIHRDEDVYLIIDGGAVGPDHLMAHAHADIFSFELSVGGVPFVVDSGVFEYAAGSMRSYVRSTKAHNTVCIDEVDQVECWGSFRVGRRFPPHDVSFTQKGKKSAFTGTFSGYAKLIGDDIVHRRRIVTDGEQRVVRIEDEITGSRTHMVESRLHLHPEVEVTEQAEQIVLQREGVTCTLHVSEGAVRWEEGWYCPAFGRRERNRVAVVGGEVRLPIIRCYSIRY